ncbi:MAG: hypothetical protein PWP09_1257 [Thermotogota bacterium]|nr:hypothetical protein [Thermotogota bacterium]
MKIRVKYLYTNSEDGLMEDAIVEFGETIESVRPYEEGEKVDEHFEHHVLMPSLVNAHTHVYSALARGIPLKSYNPRTFEEILEQLWWRLDRVLTEDAVMMSAYVAGIESLMSGVTTVFDHHSSPGFVRGSLDVLKQVLVDTIGMRGAFAYETSDRDGEKVKREAIEENLRFYRENRSSKSRGFFGLHAPFTLSDETLSEIAKLVHEESIPVHVHVSEGTEDLEDAKKKGSLPIKRLESLLAPNSIIVHGVNLQRGEFELLANKEVWLAFNPQSNMNNAVGLPNWELAKEHGVNVILGNDGFGYNLIFDVRALVLSQKLRARSTTAFGFDELKRIVFDNNYRLASSVFETKLGKIEKGHQADMVVVEYVPPTPITSENFMAHFFFGMCESWKPSRVFVGGKELLRDGRITVIDVEEIYRQAVKVSEKLWKRFDELL